MSLELNDTTTSTGDQDPAIPTLDDPEVPPFKAIAAGSANPERGDNFSGPSNPEGGGN